MEDAESLQQFASDLAQITLKNTSEQGKKMRKYKDFDLNDMEFSRLFQTVFLYTVSGFEYTVQEIMCAHHQNCDYGTTSSNF